MKKNKKKALPSTTKRNKEVYMIAYAFIILFLGMCAFMICFIVNVDDSLLSNSYNNARIEEKAKKIIRGNILTSDHTVIATTKQEEGEEKRFYPYENMFAHAVGYRAKVSTGLEELASYYILESNASLEEKIEMEFLNQRAQGNHLVTTLDFQLQKTAYEALGDRKGAIVAIEPSTGKILAMVSKPDYNPNDIADILANIENYQGEDSFLLNRVTAGKYPPGSTFKLVTTLAYMRENPTDFESFHFLCEGSFTLNNLPTINCSENAVHGTLTLPQTLQRSCNCAFAFIGQALNNKTFMQLGKDLLFDSEINMHNTVFKSTLPITNESNEWDRMMASIGQGKTVMSPLHNLMITSAIVNNGIMMKPYLMDEVMDAKGNVVETFESEKLKQVMSKEEATVLREYMISVVSDGTGYLAQGENYQSGGKTGSAQYNNVQGETHAWFVGFAPAENPTIAVCVIVEGGGSGGLTAAPIAKQMFDAYLLR